jgi:hypothetical protein
MVMAKQRGVVLCAVVFCVAMGGTLGGCATKKCMQQWATLSAEQTVAQDGRLLMRLVEKRQLTAHAQRDVGQQSSQAADLAFSVQAWELAIQVIAQLQNLSREASAAGALREQSELVRQIRCLAQAWVSRDGHIISTGAGQKMLDYRRQLEEHFGERGRPSDSQLSALCEGRGIYVGGPEETEEVPSTDESPPSDSESEEAGDGETPTDGGDGETATDGEPDV